jgi:hypothetical protein
LEAVISDVIDHNSWKTVGTQKSFISCFFLDDELLIPKDPTPQKMQNQEGSQEMGTQEKNNFISGRK